MSALSNEVVPESLALVGNVEDAPQVATIVSPESLLSRAIQQGASMETLERLMDLKDRHDAKLAKQSFMAAFAAFKANPPPVYKNKLNKQYDSWYSTLDNLVNTVNAELAKHGMTTAWDIEQGQQIKVTCILSHVDGHSERVSMTGAADTSGAKNALQQIKSTTTYLKGATFEAVTGIASADRIGVNRNDDGNASGKPQPATKVNPNDGAWEALDPDTQVALEKIAISVRDFHEAGDMAGAYAYLQKQGLDTDEKAGLNTRFDSKIRSALKKEYEASKKAAQE